MTFNTPNWISLLSVHVSAQHSDYQNTAELAGTADNTELRSAVLPENGMYRLSQLILRVPKLLKCD